MTSSPDYFIKIAMAKGGKEARQSSTWDCAFAGDNDFFGSGYHGLRILTSHLCMTDLSIVLGLSLCVCSYYWPDLAFGLFAGCWL